MGGRKLDWDKAKWDSAKAGLIFMPSNEATEADNAEMDAVLKSRRDKRLAAAKAAKRAKASQKKNATTHIERLAAWKASGGGKPNTRKKRPPSAAMKAATSTRVKDVVAQVEARARGRNSAMATIKQFERSLEKQRQACLKTSRRPKKPS